jgi:amino acid transporter
VAQYEKNSLSLAATVAMGTGVMVGAGTSALTRQVAELAGAWFPLALLLAAAVSGLSTYSYVVVSRKYPRERFAAHVDGLISPCATQRSDCVLPRFPGA